MTEPASNAASGLSSLLQNIKSVRADLTAGTESATRNAPTFNQSLDQARMQQVSKALAEPSAQDNRKEGTSANLLFTATRDPSTGAANQNSTALNDIPTTIASPDTNSQLPVATQVPEQQGAVLKPVALHAPSQLRASASSAGTLSGTVSVEVVQATRADRSTPLFSKVAATRTADSVAADGIATSPVLQTANHVPTPATSPDTNSETPVATQLLEPERAVIPVAPHASPEWQASATTARAPSGTAGGGEVSQMTFAGRSTSLSSKVAVTRTAESVVGDSVGAPLILHAANDMPITAKSPDTVIEKPVTTQLSEQKSAVLTPIAPHASPGMRASVATDGDFAVRETFSEHSAAMTQADALKKGAFKASGEAGFAVVTAPGTPGSGPADKASVSRAITVGLTQQSSGNGIVTQATLASRFRNLNSDVTGQGAKTPQRTSDTGLAKSVSPHMNATGFDAVQQRIATAEAILTQMAQDAGGVEVKAPTADNLLLAIAGGTATALTGQQSVSVAASIIQAPLNIPLASTDAESALAGNVKWMTNEGLKNAVMTVTPQGMGPISVKIGIEGGQMDVSIIASQHSTRDALESMLPRLREQLAVQGHESVKVDVSDGKSEQSRSGNGQTFAESRNPAGGSAQDNPSNSGNHDEKTMYGGTDSSESVPKSFMAEDLQRVAATLIGEADGRPVFDAYV